MATVVVGVDGSGASVEALRFALAEARLRGAGVRAIYALDVPTVAWPGLAGVVGVALEEAARVLERAVGEALDGGGACVPLDRSVVESTAAAALFEAAANADLLVVGSRGRGGFAGLLLGSVSEQCAHHARCPVAIVRASPPVPRGRIVAGVDGSDASAKALVWADREARLRHARVLAVHAWAPSRLWGARLPPAPPLLEERLEWDARAFVDRLVAEALDPERAAGVDRAVVHAYAARALVEAAADADLLVVGSRGLGGFPGLLLGSVSHQCAHLAPCPVVIVRPGA